MKSKGSCAGAPEFVRSFIHGHGRIPDYRFHLAKAKFPGRRGEPDMEICKSDFIQALRVLIEKSDMNQNLNLNL
jgi:hypothetical protein